MPIYEFMCQACGNEFEKIQSFSDTTVPVCPSCQSTQVQRRMSRPAIHFKGSGWYINDSKSSNKEGSKKATNGEAAAETSKESSGTDTVTKSEPTPVSETKTETKSEPKEVAKASGTSEKSPAA